MIRTLALALSIVALVAVVGAGTAAEAQSFKAGFVNSETIIKELPDAQKASADIEEMGLKIRDTLQMMQKEFETRIADYQKQEALMSAEAKKKEEESLNALRMRFLQYQETKTAEVQQMRESFLRPIREKVQKAIADVAKEEKLTMVLDKAVGVVLYSEDSADITFKVLDRMKRGSK
ncbi:MAG: OmpH family outer membrane protein [Candidatus Kapaibacteriota bacterium]|jgi:outer membrane protein